jgi:hypothetical protein
VHNTNTHYPEPPTHPLKRPAGIAWLRCVNKLVEGTNLPRVPEDRLEAIIARDALGCLGLR